jgi:mono/diheme cytochrome c family protein
MTIRVWAPAAALSLAAALTVGVAAGARPNPNRGKSLFRATCKTCHVKGGDAKDLSPLTKTQAQWARAFKANVPAMLPRVQRQSGNALTPEQLADMQFYLVSHAADSDQPETCGIK